MKKLYIQPKTDVCEMQPVQMLAASGVTSSIDDNDGPGYGGIDDDGSHDPAVKSQGVYNVWDDDWSK